MEQLSRHEAMGFLADQPVAHLGTVLEDAPYVTPMSFVVHDDQIFFRTMAGTKLDAIRSNPKVCVEVATYDRETGDWMSVIVTGDARLVDDARTKQSVIGLLYAKYQPVMGSPLSGRGLLPLGGDPVIIEVPISEISGLCSGRGMRTRTKPGRI